MNAFHKEEKKYGSYGQDLFPLLLLPYKLHIALKEIGNMERAVLELRYGLTGKPPMTLNEIGKRFKPSRPWHRQMIRIVPSKVGKKTGLSRETIHHIEAQAFLRLRRVAAKMKIIKLYPRQDGLAEIYAEFNQKVKDYLTEMDKFHAKT